MDDLFFRVVDSLAARFESGPSPDSFRALAAEYGLSHLAYLGINLPRSNPPGTYIVTTYNPAWVTRYVSQHYVDTDPVIRGGLSGILPIDWADVRDGTPQARLLFGEAREHGVARQGLTIPIRGRHGEIAMISLNLDVSDADWPKLKKSLVRDFVVLAHHIHLTVLEYEGCNIMLGQDLTPKELEIIKWIAEGKTIGEVATILGRTERGIRFHIVNARSKLDCVNITQLAARAVKLGLVQTCHI